MLKFKLGGVVCRLRGDCVLRLSEDDVAYVFDDFQRYAQRAICRAVTSALCTPCGITRQSRKALAPLARDFARVFERECVVEM